MKDRPNGFLAEENIDHDSEIFDYIKELHEYLWRVIRAVNAGENGHLSESLDKNIEALEKCFKGRFEKTRS